MNKIRVLVVDDMPDMRKTLSGLLSDEGCWVQTASSKDVALSLLENHNFHVAVLDVRLDESNTDNQDGISLMHEINKKSPLTAVIILTGHADIKMVQEALHKGRKTTSPALFFLEKEEKEIESLPEYVKHAYEAITPEVRCLIADGENENVEFKSSMRWSQKKNAYEKTSHIIIAKTIAGMMNSQGGKLLIGVDDEGNIIGIENDLQTLRKSNIDGFQLDLINVVKNYLSIQFVEFVHSEFELIDRKQVCIVSIDASPKPVFLNSGNKKEFWLRAGNSTRQLDVEEATEYIQNHWEKR